MVAPPTVVKVVDLALETIARYDRADLTSRLRQTRTRLLDGRVRVLVIGEFKQGKSQLVNALVNASVCPVDDDIATSVPTVVRHGEKPKAALVRVSDSDGTTADLDDAALERRTERVEVPIEKLVDHVSEAGNPGNREKVTWAEVEVPRALLAGGLELVDTPGVGGLSSVHGSTTMATLPSADAVLLVSDASQEYTGPELEFLRQAGRVCPNVACVLTKTDLYPEWRRIAELDRKHLAAAGIEAELIAVSSMLRWHAIQKKDRALNVESGFPNLIRYLRDRVFGRADEIMRRSASHDVLSVTEQLGSSLRTEQIAQQNPERIQDLIKELQEAQARANALKERSARWQQTLNDGVADLNADIDYDLRDRMREIARRAEEEIDIGGDPNKMWDQFSAWVEQEAAAAASSTFVWATQRARFLATQVADHFAADGNKVLPALRTDPAGLMNVVDGVDITESEKWGPGEKVLTGLRGGYIGVLMFGLLGTFIGMSIINPFSVVAGLVLGGKAISDEKKRQASKRQNEAKMATRRYIDDVTFQVSKDARDMLRRVQRGLRDHFTGEAEEMNQSLRESLQSAEKSMKTSTSDRERRLSEIKAELERLAALEKRVRTLLSAPPPEAVA